MLKYTETRSNTSQFIALTSLTVKEFEDLLVGFTAEWEYEMSYFTFEGQLRNRKYTEKGQRYSAINRR